jgi:hypothetical protein
MTDFNLNTAEDYEELRDFMTNCVLIQTRFINSVKSLVAEYKAAVASSVASKGFKMSKKIPVGVTGGPDRVDWDLQGLNIEPNPVDHFGTPLLYKRVDKMDDDSFVKAQVDRAMLLYFFGVEPTNPNKILMLPHNAPPLQVAAFIKPPPVPVPLNRRVLTAGATSIDASIVTVGRKGDADAILHGSSPQALLNFIYFTQSLIAGGGIPGKYTTSISTFMLTMINSIQDDASLKKEVLKLLGDTYPVLGVLPFNAPSLVAAAFANLPFDLTAPGALGRIPTP